MSPDNLNGLDCIFVMYLFCSTGDWPQGPVHTRRVFYQLRLVLTALVRYLRSHDFCHVPSHFFSSITQNNSCLYFWLLPLLCFCGKSECVSSLYGPGSVVALTEIASQLSPWSYESSFHGPCTYQACQVCQDHLCLMSWQISSKGKTDLVSYASWDTFKGERPAQFLRK